MDEYMIGIIALGITVVFLFFGLKVYDRFRYRHRKPQQGDLLDRR